MMTVSFAASLVGLSSKACAIPTSTPVTGTPIPAASIAAPPAAGGPWASAVRVVAMSDTHGFHRSLTVPYGDILVHCGDAESHTMQKYDHMNARRANAHTARHPHTICESFEAFSAWFAHLPHREKVFVQGNHETISARFLLKQYSLKGARTLCGLKAFGIPYDKGGTGYMKIPSGLDLLLSHEPPFQILDLATHGSSGVQQIGSRTIKEGISRLARVSNADLQKENRTLPPRVHVFGHVHEARGFQEKSGTTFINAANANPGKAKYLSHGCVVFDVSTDSSKLVRIVKGFAGTS